MNRLSAPMLLMRSTLGAIALAVVIVGSPAAWACGYHDPSSINLGMLNLAYPDALHVRTAVWMAQRDRLISGHEQPEATDSPTARLSEMLRLRETALALGEMRDRLDAGADGQAVPAFSMVLIRSMLWTRFEPAGATLNMAVHAAGPAREDVVIVTDEPVIGALLDGRLTAEQARQLGLVRLYGSPADAANVASLLDRLTAVKAAAAVTRGDAAPQRR